MESLNYVLLFLFCTISSVDGSLSSQFYWKNLKLITLSHFTVLLTNYICLLSWRSFCGAIALCEHSMWRHLQYQDMLVLMEDISLVWTFNVAAFAVSGYACTDGRHCKPFDPLLGETYETDYPDKSISFFSEKVSFSMPEAS